MARSSIYVGEIAHQSPIPNASRIGNIIVSGLIRGADPATAKLAATLEQQCAFMFLHMRQAVEAGGATVEDIIKVTVWMKELQRKPVNDEWVKMFPDPASTACRMCRNMNAHCCSSVAASLAVAGSAPRISPETMMLPMRLAFGIGD